MTEFELLSVVALLQDMPARKLRQGQVGTIVETLGGGMYEVEFSDDSGQAYATLAINGDRLMQLHHTPQDHAA